MPHPGPTVHCGVLGGTFHLVFLMAWPLLSLPGERPFISSLNKLLQCLVPLSRVTADPTPR
jgi:hypothetical protein